jgi:hypothetical protein
MGASARSEMSQVSWRDAPAIAAVAVDALLGKQATLPSPKRATTRALVRSITIVRDSFDWSRCSTMNSIAVSIHLWSTCPVVRRRV